MTEQQQELYDKLLKKVNEFCLGQAAEDVIECIDALVENYEDRLTEADGYATKYAEALESYRNHMKEWQSGHSVDFSKVRFEIQNLLPDPVDIEKKLKALEIIKKYNIHNCSVIMATDSYKDYKICWVYDTTKMTEQEYELLKEVLK